MWKVKMTSAKSLEKGPPKPWKNRLEKALRKIRQPKETH
jgi:hypothetical protein